MPSEVLNFIKKAQIKRAPGREGITNKILRNLTLPVIFQITNIISNIFITGHFPESWKHASVIPILKPGKPRSAADSYRSISLLPVLSKLAERLNDYLTTNKILISQQHGFRPQLSTSHQLLRVVEYAKSGFKEKKCTGAVFLDIQKAFDRVWHTGLLYKLIKINAPPQLILIIKFFLTNRSFAVRVNDTHSSTKQIRAGAPQGALLSPTLFNIYINDIPKTRQTTVCLYADDTAILTQSTNKKCITHFLHRHLAELEDWYNKWKISINPEKTEAVFFSAGHSTLAASLLVERKVTLRSLNPTALAATPSTPADGKGKERNRFAGLSLPQPPSATIFAAGSTPLRRASRQALEAHFSHTHDSQTQTLAPLHTFTIL
ncbi:RNA-directed DNA polymerase from mobile element jockey [Trichonephila clavipes]|nr:RNA-directed DNA polymerase from mobile element jockey [Trichonephila clavipes]